MSTTERKEETYPEYQPESMEYQPELMEYQPESPSYQPESPSYQPESPSYQQYAFEAHEQHQPNEYEHDTQSYMQRDTHQSHKTNDKFVRKREVPTHQYSTNNSYKPIRHTNDRTSTDKNSRHNSRQYDRHRRDRQYTRHRNHRQNYQGYDRRRYTRRYDNDEIIRFIRSRQHVDEDLLIRKFPGVDKYLRSIPDIRFITVNGRRTWSFYHFDQLCTDIMEAISLGHDNIDLIQSHISHRYASIRKAIDVLVSEQYIGIYDKKTTPVVYYCI